MTSPRSRPRPSSGSERARWALLALVALAPAAVRAASDDAKLAETRQGVSVDWQAGTLTASGGAAADLRMPSVDLARPGALRRAQAAATTKLRAALAGLPLGAGKKLAKEEIDRALGRARTADVQYQSNGGAIVRVEVRVGDWLEPAAPAAPVAALTVPAMALGAAPTVRLGPSPAAKGASRDVRMGGAVYRLGDPPAGTTTVAARVDSTGRLTVSGDGDLADKLAHGLAVIYVHKVQR